MIISPHNGRSWEPDVIPVMPNSRRPVTYQANRFQNGYKVDFNGLVSEILPDHGKSDWELFFDTNRSQVIFDSPNPGYVQVHIYDNASHCTASGATIRIAPSIPLPRLFPKGVIH